MTVPSWEQLAIVDFTSPRLGAQATSRTQSTWLDRGGKQSSFQLPFKNFQTLTVLSQPPETSFCTSPGSAPTREPGALAGAQETDVTPTGWACSILAFSHDPSTFWVKTEIVPSDDPQARHSPNSCGAQQMLFTDDSCSWNTCGNAPILISQIRFSLRIWSAIHITAGWTHHSKTREITPNNPHSRSHIPSSAKCISHKLDKVRIPLVLNRC